MRMRCLTILQAFAFGSYISWISFPNDILVELFTKYFASQSPHMTFASLPTKYVLDLKVVVCYLAIHRREFVVFNLVLKKTIMVASCSFTKPYNDGFTSCKCLVHLNHTRLCRQHLSIHNIVYY